MQSGRTPSASGRVPWPARNVLALKAAARIAFGMFWAVDGALKFQPGLVGAFPSMISEAAQGQPGWLAGWFSMWHSVVLADPAFFVYGTGVCELAVALCLLVGLARKAVYVFGFFLSLLIWAVPEGFGGPYGPNSTDIGTGIVYALAFLMLAVISSAFGPSRLSLDGVIESRWKAWSRVAEFRHGD